MSRSMMLLCIVALLAALGAGSLLVPATTFAQEPSIEWIRQFGGAVPGSEYNNAQAVDANENIYMVGYTSGILPDQNPSGAFDGYIRKYNADGNEIWTRQFGSTAEDRASDVAVDNTAVYVVGYTYGAFPNQSYAGARDAFIRKYDMDGNHLWTRQFGVASTDHANGVAVDSSGVYVIGDTSGALPGQTYLGYGDAYIRKYDTDGNEIWTQQFGTSTYDFAYGVAIDDSGVYVAGTTNGYLGQTAFGYPDGYIRKYDSNGNHLWTQQFGTSTSEELRSITVDSSGVYVTGTTYGLLGESSAGANDAYVRKYNTDGTYLWTQQFGSTAADYAYGLAVDSSTVYVVGYTAGVLPEQTKKGSWDAYIRAYDTEGNHLWTQQFGTPIYAYAYGVAAENSSVYVIGIVGGALPDQISSGGADAYIRKYDMVGGEVWTRQFGSGKPGNDAAQAVDAKGSIIVAGSTYGVLPNQTSAGHWDAYLRQYDSHGNEVWTRQFGSPAEDRAYGIAVDDSSIYIVGYTFGALPGQTNAGNIDAFIRKYDSDGNEAWTRQFGTAAANRAYGVAVDNSGIYVVGETYGALPGQIHLGGYDAYLRKYDPNGNEVWTRQFGTSGNGGDFAYGVTVDNSGVYVTGYTSGAFSGETNLGGTYDAFVRMYTVDGVEGWTRQFGSTADDRAYSITVDSSGIYVAGYTAGVLPNQTSLGSRDAYVRKYDKEGNEVWTHQFGTSSSDSAYGIVADASGIYVTGATNGRLGQSLSGDADVYIRKFDTSGSEEWTHQFGSTLSDTAYGISVDSSGVYVVGTTYGTLPGQASTVATDAFLVKIPKETIPLVISPTVVGSLGNNGWYTSNVTVSWTITGDDASIVSTSGCDTTTIREDTNGTTLVCTVITTEGTVAETITIQRDATAPTASTSIFPGPNSYGWNKTDVTVSFHGADNLSGIASCDAPVVLSVEGAGQSASGRCTDRAGNVSDAATATGISIDKTAPTPIHAGPFTVDEGSTILLDGRVSTDTLSGVQSTSWSLDGDNLYNDGDPASFTRPDGPSTHGVALKVVDNAGNEAIVETWVTVNNVAPTVATPIATPEPSDEGDAVTISAIFSDPSTQETFTCMVDYGNSAGPQPGIIDGNLCVGPSYVYADPGIYTITVAVTDKDGDTGTNSTSHVVNEAMLTVEAGPDQHVNEGEPVTVEATFTDSCPLCNHAAPIEWGDGTPADNGVVGMGTVSGSHTYRDNGVYTVTISVTNAKGNTQSDFLVITVDNVAPTLDAFIGMPNVPIAVGTLINVQSPFDDPGDDDTHTAFWQWDANASPDPGTVDQQNQIVVGSHVYNTPGVYRVTLTLMDDDLGSDTAFFEYIVVYDPEGGFVTGGGWINSPAGAYAPDPLLTGKANFGFNSKYKKGATVPSGDTRFQFKAGDMHFLSTSYDWLVVAGAKAQFKGVGTLNGSGDYGFMLSAIDGQINGGGGVDKFRIKIWDRSNGDAVIYDNQMDATEDATPATELGGGNIVIHNAAVRSDVFAEMEEISLNNRLYLPVITAD